MSARPLNEAALETAVEAVRSRNMFTLDGAVAEGVRAYLSALTAAGYRLIGPAKFDIGERVTKIKGSSWTGKVVGFYSTSLTPMGYAVESENEPGSAQIYPEAALRSLQGGEDA
jgi:hypothetical protein